MYILIKKQVIFAKQNKDLLTGDRNKLTGMWEANITIDNNIQTAPTSSQTQYSNFILPYKPTGESIKFMHGTCFSPCTTTWCTAIDKGYFKSWPRLTSARVRKYIKVSDAISKGQLT